MGDGWLTPYPARSFLQQRDAVPTVQEAERAPEPVWTGAENLAPQPLDLLTV
jgi:hypothetical protein